MDRRLKALLAIIGGFIIILLIIYVIFFRAPAEPLDTSGGSQSGQGADTSDFPQGSSQTADSQAEESRRIKIGINAAKQGQKISQTDLTRMAASFAERFGSYSNQSGFANISDLEVFMTINMQQWSRNYIKEMKARQADNLIYYGITTMAITNELKNFDEDEGQAEVLVKTQRRESVGSFENSKTFYQDITIFFAKENGIWKVDRAAWK